jgi:hypothetical protein
MRPIFFRFLPAPVLYITYRRRWRVNNARPAKNTCTIYWSVVYHTRSVWKLFAAVSACVAAVIHNDIHNNNWKELEMRLVNCSNVDRGRCLHSRSEFRSVHWVRWAGVALYTCIIRATTDAISSRCLCSTNA